MMRRTMIALLLALAALLGLSQPAHAAELPDETRSGSITFVMEFEDEPLDSGRLTICRVGVIHISNGSAGFVLVDELSGGPSLENPDDPALAEKLAKLAREKALPTRRADIRKGRAPFANLEPGMYVVTQTDADASNGFDPIRPFLISLPQWQNDAYCYELTASPKVPLETEPAPTEPSKPTEPTTPGPGKPNLPQTGQLNWPVPILTILGLSFFTVGWVLCFRHGRDEYET